MRIETLESSIKLVEALPNGEWAIRWDFGPKPAEEGVYWYEEVIVNYIPTIEDVQSAITEWFNRKTNALILHGFVWNGRSVLLTDENKFNFKAIIDECARVETAIAIWDKDTAANDEPRPETLLPITLKLGKDNTPDSFYVFYTLAELQDFFNAGVHHLINAYAVGWTQIATFDYTPYIEALKELE